MATLPTSVSRFPLPTAYKPTGTLHFPAKPGAERKPAPRRERRPNSALRSSLVERQSPAKGGAAEVEAEVHLQELEEFLRGDLPHLFDERGIDRTRYDRRVRFRDPITKHETVEGYLFNIWLLKLLFSPDFYLHHVKQVIICSFLMNYFGIDWVISYILCYTLLVLYCENCCCILSATPLSYFGS